MKNEIKDRILWMDLLNICLATDKVTLFFH